LALGVGDWEFTRTLLEVHVDTEFDHPRVLRRFAEFSKDGNELNVHFPPARDQQGRMVATWVTLRRLSGEAEMLGNNTK
jgi:hypothetical protein